MLASLEYRIPKRVFPAPPDWADGRAYEGKSKLGVLLGEDFFSQAAGKTVIDFGCGEGADAVEIASRGAERVFGIDIRPEVLERARQRAQAAGVQDRCVFLRPPEAPQEVANIVVSVDAFEHFADPAGILDTMHALLRPGGAAVIGFGQPWLHPLGGHLFSVFPWAHLVLSEEALIRWRSTFKTDGARRFSEVAGGLNQMTIKRFETLVADSPFDLDRLELVPVRRLRRLHNRWTREFTTAVVRCRLSKGRR